MGLRTRRRSDAVTAWPGYVDALSALLIVVIFVLMVFVVLQFIVSDMLNRRESELTILNEKIVQLTRMFGLEQEKNVVLTSQVAKLSGTIDRLDTEKQQLVAATMEYEAQSKIDQDKLKNQMLSIVSLNEDIEALRQLKNQLEEKVGLMAQAISADKKLIASVRDRSKALKARLAQQQEVTFLAQETIKGQDIRIQALSAVAASQKKALESEQRLSADARAEVTRLSEQLERLQAQLETIKQALSVSLKEGLQKDAQIKDLGKRLNIELARRVNKLEKYRSEFFGRVKEILAENKAVQIQGDRFVFQAGLLFESGSAKLGETGQKPLATLAATLLDVAGKIPKDINWILRIDGHTDRVPIHNEQFSSNWELSVARALSVVRFLAENGIDEKRLTAAGFSSFHPVDPGDTTEAYRKNRRIEVKLTTQ